MFSSILIPILIGVFIPLCITIVRSVIEWPRSESVRPWPEWRRGLLIGFGGAAILTGLFGVSDLYTKALLFSQLKFSSVYWTRFWTEGILFVVATLTAAVILSLVTRSARKIAEPLPDNEGSRYGNWLTGTKIVETTRLFLIWAASALLALWPTSQWQKVLVFFNPTTSGIVDPIFEKDASSFYMQSYPLFSVIINWLFALFLIGGVGLTLLYWFYSRTYDVFSQKQRKEFYEKMSRSVPLNLIPFLVLAFFSTWQTIYGVVFSKYSVFSGANYTDVFARVGGYRIFMFLTAVAIVVMIIGAIQKKWKITIWSLTGFVASWILITLIYPNFIQNIITQSTELEKEKKYIEINIRFTRQAFDLEKFKEKPFVVKNDLTWADIEEAKKTIDNVRLWDWRILQLSYQQLQGIRSYYQFLDVDIDRYIINGQYRQVMLSARELVQKSTWVNDHFKFGHGYGLCLSLANEFSRDKLPNFIVKNFPPVSSAPEIQISRPEIYYGEGTFNHVYINTTTEEFNYPQGDQNAYSRYEGDGTSVRIGSGLRKLMFAIRFDGIKMLTSQYLTPESRIKFKRQIQERLHMIAPLLIYDEDPYLVRLNQQFWIIDAFTASSKYPCSMKHYSGCNYIRNSVKVVIDAYTGEVTFYVVDDQDPLIRSWMKIFPDLFTPYSEMPEELREHIRYPEDIFTIQSEMYGRYHVTDPEVFYNREDVWTRANEIYGDTSAVVEPYFLIMQLPEESKEEFVQILPFTPDRKDNMIGWIAGRSDGDKYGKTFVYKLPKDIYIAGCKQIEAKIDQDDEMSGQIGLWKKSESKVIRGKMMVIPIKNSFIYVKPIFLQSKDSPIPQLTKIVVAYGEDLVWADDFQTALRKIFLEPAVEKTLMPTLSSPSQYLLLEKIRQNLQEAMKKLEQLEKEQIQQKPQ